MENIEAKVENIKLSSEKPKEERKSIKGKNPCRDVKLEVGRNLFMNLGLYFFRNNLSI